MYRFDLASGGCGSGEHCVCKNYKRNRHTSASSAGKKDYAHVGQCSTYLYGRGKSGRCSSWFCMVAPTADMVSAEAAIGFAVCDVSCGDVESGCAVLLVSAFEGCCCGAALCRSEFNSWESIDDM